MALNLSTFAQLAQRTYPTTEEMNQSNQVIADYLSPQAQTQRLQLSALQNQIEEKRRLQDYLKSQPRTEANPQAAEYRTLRNLAQMGPPERVQQSIPEGRWDLLNNPPVEAGAMPGADFEQVYGKEPAATKPISMTRQILEYAQANNNPELYDKTLNQAVERAAHIAKISGDEPALQAFNESTGLGIKYTGTNADGSKTLELNNGDVLVFNPKKYSPTADPSTYSSIIKTGAGPGGKQYLSRTRPAGRQTIFEESTDGGRTWREVSRGERDKPTSSGGGNDKQKSRPIPSATEKRLTSSAELADSMDRFSTGFQPSYAGHTITGDFSNVAGRILGDDSGQAQWWQDYQGYVNDVRQEKFGASLTNNEKNEFLKYIVTPRMTPTQVTENLSRQKAITDTALARVARGYATQYDPQTVEEFIGRPIPAAEAAQAPKITYGKKQPQSTSSGPKLGTVEGGYRFKGGDPANPASWVKVGR